MKLQERRDAALFRALMLRCWGRRIARGLYLDCGRNPDAFLTFARSWLEDHKRLYPHNADYRDGFSSFVASVRLRATREEVTR